MRITALPKTGNSAKFQVVLAKDRGEFMVSLSYTLCHKVWGLENEAAELAAASQMIEAIVSRHDPVAPYREKYIFGDHNAQSTLEATVQYLRRVRI